MSSFQEWLSIMSHGRGLWFKRSPNPQPVPFVSGFTKFATRSWAETYPPLGISCPVLGCGRTNLRPEGTPDLFSSFHFLVDLQVARKCKNWSYVSPHFEQSVTSLLPRGLPLHVGILNFTSWTCYCDDEERFEKNTRRGVGWSGQN